MLGGDLNQLLSVGPLTRLRHHPRLCGSPPKLQRAWLRIRRSAAKKESSIHGMIAVARGPLAEGLC